MTSILNNLYITIKYGWPVLLLFTVLMLASIIGFYLYDFFKERKFKKQEPQQAERNLDLKMAYFIGGLDGQINSDLGSGNDGNIFVSLAHRKFSQGAHCLKGFLQSIGRSIKYIIKEGDYMPEGEKLLAHNIIQLWVILLMTIRFYAVS